MTEKKSRFSTNQLNIDLFASLIFAFTILTIACMGLLYVQIIDLGYLHLFSVIILTEIFVLIRRIRIKLVPMFLLHVLSMVLYLGGMSFLLTWQGKKDIQAGLIFLGVMAAANLVYSMLRRFQKSSVSVTHDVFIASLALHLVLYIIASIVDMGTKVEEGASSGAGTIVRSLSGTGATRHFILLNTILIVCVYLVARQLYTFDTKYHHNTHSSTQPVKQVNRQNHLTIAFIFGGILLALLVLNTIPVSTILSGLRSLVVMIGRFFAQFLPNEEGSMSGPDDASSQQDDMKLPDPGDGGEPLFVQILIVMFVVFVIITAWVRFKPMLLFYIILVPAAILFIRRAAKPVLTSKATLRHHTESTNAAFKEMLDMDRLTRAQGMQKTEYNRIFSKVRLVQNAANYYDQLGVWVNNITYGGSQGFRLICLCFAAYLANRGYISVGTVVLFQSIFEMIISSVQKVLDEMPQIVQGYDSLISVNEILFERDVERNGTVQLPEPVQGAIEMRDVVFSYGADQPPVLDKVSLSIPAGSSAAFIGKSGAGKTTLMNLILGLYAKQSGEITIDGIDIDALDKNSFRRHVAVVPQNTVLFSGTLWDNLVYGLKYVSLERVMAVIRRVGLDDLLESLPDGLNSQIYEDGGNLSGGQRQRIAIARALLRDASIILFDEATSALDSDSERQVQSAIDAVMAECTVIMVAHRLNTLRKVDRIYRIEDGKATPCNSFEEIIGQADAVFIDEG